MQQRPKQIQTPGLKKFWKNRQPCDSQGSQPNSARQIRTENCFKLDPSKTHKSMVSSLRTNSYLSGDYLIVDSKCRFQSEVFCTDDPQKLREIKQQLTQRKAQLLEKQNRLLETKRQVVLSNWGHIPRKSSRKVLDLTKNRVGDSARHSTFATPFFTHTHFSTLQGSSGTCQTHSTWCH